jgi:hypothetical protein
MPMTTEQQSTAIRLRREAMSYVKIAHQIGLSEKMVTKFLRSMPDLPKPSKKPKLKVVEQPNRKIEPARLLPKHQLNRSCPMRKLMDPNYRMMPKPTREQLEQRLAIAVRNYGAVGVITIAVVS